MDAQHLLVKFARASARRVRRRARARPAGSAVIFALAIIPIMASLARRSTIAGPTRSRSALQARGGLNRADVRRRPLPQRQARAIADPRASAISTRFFIRPEASGPQIVAIYDSTNGSRVQVTATANVATNLHGPLWASQPRKSAPPSQVNGATPGCVALVLDNTGSMLDDGKCRP